MLSVLASIAYKLESANQPKLADQIDDIITSLGNHESFAAYSPGELWSEEHEGMEPDEDYEAEGLVDRSQDEVGLSNRFGYSHILLEHPEPFKKYIREHPLVRKLRQNGRNPGYIQNLSATLIDGMEHFLDDLSANGTHPIEWDEGFYDVASKLIYETLKQISKPQA